LKNSFG